MEGLGAPHRDHHHQVAQHPHQEDEGLEHSAHQPIQGSIILWIRTVDNSLLLMIPDQFRKMEVLGVSLHVSGFDVELENIISLHLGLLFQLNQKFTKNCCSLPRCKNKT